MSFLKYRGSSSRNRPLTLITPSIVSDTPQARVKVEQDYKKIVREMVRYVGVKRVKELNKELGMERKGNKSDRSLDKQLLDEWDAAITENPAVTRTEVARSFCKRYRQQSVRAVEKRLTRLLQVRERNAERERKLRATLQRPSLLNE
jgi:hypothetical protein